MAFLKLVDDDGTETQFDIEHISVENCQPGDALIITVEIGNADPTLANQHMTRVEALFTRMTEHLGVKVACLASRFGKRDITLDVVHKET